ncbi:MAG: substrate-binding domain-containing protein [Actinobacteria bacterium]|nr:substrate-binding domain-containing protein [Actinomycetota bacterium]
MGTQARARTGIGIVLTAALLLSGCGGGGDSGGDDGSSAGIVIRGSSTVEPISSRIAELFQDEGSGVPISVGIDGTGKGFSDFFCTGEADIADASRPMKASEYTDVCEPNGVTDIIELVIGIDGIAALTSPETEDVGECLSFSDIYGLVGPESTGFSNWQDANPIVEELGGGVAAPFPDLALTTFGPGTESGTFDSFLEIALEPAAEQRAEAEAIDATQAETPIRDDWTGSANDDVIIETLGGTPGSFGWVGYAFFSSNQERVKAFQIDGGDGTCVTPTEETIQDGSYPLSRPLFIYVNADKLETSPALVDFVDFYLSETGQRAVADVGYVNVADETWQETLDRWNERTLIDPSELA